MPQIKTWLQTKTWPQINTSALAALTFLPQGGCYKTAVRRRPKTMRLLILLAVLISLAPDDVAFAQLSGTGDFHIVWEVKNRFRLFRREADFLRHPEDPRDAARREALRRLPCPCASMVHSRSSVCAGMRGPNWGTSRSR